MGRLIHGVWYTDQQVPENDDAGNFINDEGENFNHWITKDGSAGPTGLAGFTAEPGRYHLYVSYACPWAQRTLIMRELKGLQSAISVSVVDALMGDDGWTLANGADPVNDASLLRDVYTMSKKDYSGKVTVPVLWDKHQNKIVNNNSAEIILMLNDAFASLEDDDTDYYPDQLRDKITVIDELLYDGFIVGVYHAGFATSQAAYSSSVERVFETLDWLENHLEKHAYLVGHQPTVSDIKLFTSLIRFDPVYHGHFKCNRRRIIDYPNIRSYVQRLFKNSAMRQTTNWQHITSHYYGSHLEINPTGIVPIGPSTKWMET